VKLWGWSSVSVAFLMSPRCRVMESGLTPCENLMVQLNELCDFHRVFKGVLKYKHLHYSFTVYCEAESKCSHFVSIFHTTTLHSTYYILWVTDLMCRIWGSDSGGYENFILQNIMANSLVKVNHCFREICHFHLQG
jgi:hypothetical protein